MTKYHIVKISLERLLMQKELTVPFLTPYGIEDNENSPMFYILPYLEILILKEKRNIKRLDVFNRVFLRNSNIEQMVLLK